MGGDVAGGTDPALAPAPAPLESGSFSVYTDTGQGQGVGTRHSTRTDAVWTTATASDSYSPERGNLRRSGASRGSHGDGLELQASQDEVSRLRQLVEAQERHIAVLSAGNDENLRRQIAMQERLNALDHVETDAGALQRLRGEMDLLRAAREESERRGHSVALKLAASEQTVAKLRREKQDRTEELESTAVQQLAALEQEYQSDLKQCREVIRTQEEQLDRLDVEAAGER